MIWLRATDFQDWAEAVTMAEARLAYFLPSLFLVTSVWKMARG